MWDILFQGGIERREIKEMDGYEKWKLKAQKPLEMTTLLSVFVREKSIHSHPLNGTSHKSRNHFFI